SLRNRRREVRRILIGATVVIAVLSGVSSALLAQRGQPAGPAPAGQGTRGGGAAAAAAPSPPAPVHDLTGVWMMRNPPGSNRGFTNYTFTDPKTDPPALTPWGEARLKEAKDSNGGNYTLAETNDPV